MEGDSQRMSAIELQQVAFAYGGGPEAISAVTLGVEAGEIVGLLGANGAGKTTLLRLVVGLLQPLRGSIRIGGLSLPQERKQVGRLLGYMPDRSLLYPRLSGLENLNRFATLWQVPAAEAKARSEALLRAANLWDARDRWVESYSKGMRQQLSYCVAVIHEPKVLVLDEPFDGLDIGAALALRDWLQTRARAGGAILVSSHLADALDAIAHRVAVLESGRVVEVLEAAEVARRGGSARVFVEAHERSPQATELRKSP